MGAHGPRYNKKKPTHQMYEVSIALWTAVKITRSIAMILRKLNTLAAISKQNMLDGRQD
jgi:hypothetical protein